MTSLVGETCEGISLVRLGRSDCGDEEADVLPCARVVGEELKGDCGVHDSWNHACRHARPARQHARSSDVICLGRMFLPSSDPFAHEASKAGRNGRWIACCLAHTCMHGHIHKTREPRCKA